MKFNPDIEKAIELHATKWGIDPTIAKSLVFQESSGNPNAKSPVGAKGLTQIMDPIAKKYGAINPFDVNQNLDAGFHYLSDLKKQYKGNTEEALAHYNGGPGAVQYFRKKGGVFYDSSMAPSTWAHQTGHYVKNIMANAGMDTKHIPTGKRDEIIAQRAKIPKDTAGGPVIAESLDPKKKVPLTTDTSSGIQLLPTTQEAPMSSMFARAGQSTPLETIGKANPANLLFTPVSAQVNSGLPPLAQQALDEIESGQSQTPVVTPQMNQQTQEPLKTGTTFGQAIIPTFLQNIKSVPAAVYGGASIPINELAGPLDQTKQDPLLPPWDTDTEAVRDISRKDPAGAFIGNVASDIPSVAISTATGTAVKEVLIREALKKAGAAAVGTAIPGALPVLGGLAAAGAVGTLLNLGKQIGTVQAKEIKMRQSGELGPDSLSEESGTTPGKSLPLAGGVDTLKRLNYAEGAITGITYAAGQEIPAVLKGGISAAKAGIAGLKQAPNVAKGIFQLPKTAWDTFFDTLQTNYLSEVEKIELTKFVDSFTQKLLSTETVGDILASFKKQVGIEQGRFNQAIQELSNARKFTSEQRKVLKGYIQEFNQSYKKLTDNITNNKFLTKEELALLEDNYKMAQQHLALNASKFGLSRDTVRNLLKQMRISRMKLDAFKNASLKLRGFSKDAPSGQALFSLNAQEKRLAGKTIKGKVDKSGKPFEESVERLTGIDLINKITEWAGRGDAYGLLANRIRNIQLTIDDELFNNPPVGKTAQEFEVIMNDLEGLAKELGIKFEKMAPNELKKLGSLLSKLENKLEKKGIVIQDFEDEVIALSEEIATLTASITKQAQQVADPFMYKNNLFDDVYRMKELLAQARSPEEGASTILEGAVSLGRKWLHNIRTAVLQQAVNVSDGLGYFEIMGSKGAKETNLLIKGFLNASEKAEVAKSEFNKLLRKANINPRSFADNLLAGIQRKVPTDKVLAVETETVEGFVKSLKVFVNEFKEIVPQLNNPRTVKELTRERFRALQEVVQKIMPERRRANNIPRESVLDPYFHEQRGRVISTEINEQIAKIMEEAFGIKKAGTIQTKVLKAYAMKKHGLIKDEELLESFALGNHARITTSYLKEAIESMYASFTELLTNKAVSEDVEALMFSVVAQLSSQADRVVKSGIEESLVKTLSGMFRYVTGAVLDTPAFVMQNLDQAVNSLARYSDKPKVIQSTIKALTDPKLQKELFLGIRNLGGYSNTASDDILDIVAPGSKTAASEGFETLLAEFGQELTLGLDRAGAWLGKISRQDFSGLSAGVQKTVQFSANFPMIHLSENVLRTWTSALALFDKFGDNTLNVLRSVNQLALKEGNFTRRGAKLGSDIDRPRGIQLNPQESSNVISIEKPLREKLGSIRDEAQQVINQAIEQDLFVKSPYSSLISSQLPGLFRFSTFAFRQTGYQIKLALTKPDNYIRFLQMQLAAGGSQAVIPYVRNINFISQFLFGGDFIDEAQFANADKKLRAGEISGARILGQFNKTLDQGIGNKITPDILGIFPIEASAAETFAKVQEQFSNKEWGEALGNLLPELIPWLSGAIGSATGLVGKVPLPEFLHSKIVKFAAGNPLASSRQKKVSDIDSGLITVGSSDGRYSEDIPITSLNDKILVKFGLGSRNLWLRRYVSAKGRVKNQLRTEVSTLSDFVNSVINEDQFSPSQRRDLYEKYINKKHERLFSEEELVDTFSSGFKGGEDVARDKILMSLREFEIEQLNYRKADITEAITKISFQIEDPINTSQYNELVDRRERLAALGGALYKLAGGRQSPSASLKTTRKNVQEKAEEAVRF